MFTLLLETINVEMVKALCSVGIEQNKSVTNEGMPAEKTQMSQPSHQQARPNLKPSDEQQSKRTKKIGRNDACPCGSGKKYKHCHG